MIRRTTMAAVAAFALLVPLGTAPMAAAADSSPAFEIAPGEALTFDFGCPDRPVSEGHIEVGPGTAYAPETGYGISTGTPDCRNREAPQDTLRRDFLVGWDYEFTVDLPDGDYHLTVISGDHEAANNTSVTVNGEGQGTLNPRDPGEFAHHDVETTVDDGQLTVAMRDDGRLNGLIISQVTAPTGLEVSGTSVDPAQVNLTWEAMEGATSYTIFRSAAGVEDFTEVGTAADPGFTDEEVETGFTYDYAITQTTQAGVVSGRSESVQAQVTDPDVAPPSAPEDLSITQADEYATAIEWADSADTDQYHVHRALSANSGGERIGTTAEPQFEIEGSSEHSWYYTVTAVNQGGVSQRSEALVTPRTADPVADGEVHPQCGQGTYHAEVERSGDSWQAHNSGAPVYEGYSMHEAMQAAVDSLSEGRTQQESVVVRGSGTMPADIAVELPSHTSFEVCGTIHIAGSESPFSYEQHMGAVAIRHAQNISVPYLTLTGTPNFGVYLRTSEYVHFGQMHLDLSGGHGMRMDSRDDDSVREARNISIDDVYVSGTESHGVETYGVDGLTIGTVTAVETGEAGVLLNDTINADIDSVIGHNAAAGTGYATFRTANQNGMIDGAYPTNIRVGEVIADGGGRGVFCVSESGGLAIDRVEISGTENNAMLLENCHNITIATDSGTVEDSGELVISARDEFDNNTDLTLQNLTVRNNPIREAVCGENTVLRNLTLENSELDTCAELQEPDPEPSPTEPEPNPEPENEDDADSEWIPEAVDLTAETEGLVTIDPAQAQVGDQVTISAEAQHANQEVSTWLLSEPVAAEEGTFDDDATMSITVPEVDPGEHQLAVYTAEGQLLGWSPFTVVEESIEAATADTATSTSPPVTEPPETSPELAETGMPQWALVLGLAGLAASALGLMLVRSATGRR